MFIGTISALSIRAFLKNARQIFSAVARARGAAPIVGAQVSSSGVGAGPSLVLLLSELTGVYAISSVLLIRKNVPLKYRSVIDAVLGGDLEFQFFHRWFNGLFLASALITAGLYYFQYKSGAGNALEMLPTHTKKADSRL